MCAVLEEGYFYLKERKNYLNIIISSCWYEEVGVV